MRIIPFDRLSMPWINRDGKLIILSRGLGAFAQSSIAILLALYLDKLGFNLTQIGAFLSAGIAGSALFAFIISLTSERLGRRHLLVMFTLISAFSGLALIFIDAFLPLIFFAFVGSITGRGGAGHIQSLEKASLSETASLDKRTDLFSIYRIITTSGAALGTLAAGLPIIFQTSFSISEINAYRVILSGFAFLNLASALVYSMLSSSIEAVSSERRWNNPLRLPSRRLIFTLTGLFSLDFFAGALFMESIAAYWFHTKFGLELEALALVFFLSHVLVALSLWFAAKLANRIGLLNTIVFTHVPANLFLIAAAFAPTASIAIVFWQLRAFFSQMDVPTKDSYTMSIVQPNERVTMAGINTVGQSISGTIGPSVGMALWQAFSASMPLIVNGVLRIVYDLSLYITFRNVKPQQELSEE